MALCLLLLLLLLLPMEAMEIEATHQAPLCLLLLALFMEKVKPVRVTLVNLPLVYMTLVNMVLVRDTRVSPSMTSLTDTGLADTIPIEVAMSSPSVTTQLVPFLKPGSNDEVLDGLVLFWNLVSMAKFWTGWTRLVQGMA